MGDVICDDCRNYLKESWINLWNENIWWDARSVTGMGIRPNTNIETMFISYGKLKIKTGSYSETKYSNEMGGQFSCLCTDLERYRWYARKKNIKRASLSNRENNKKEQKVMKKIQQE